MKYYSIVIDYRSRVKEEYRYIPMWKFVSLDPVFEKLGYNNLKGMYQINKLGWIRNIKRGSVTTPSEYYVNKANYPQYYFGDRRKGKTLQIPIHKIFALLFIINDDPVNKTVVDHINFGKKNRNVFSIETIRWATPKENRNNSSKINRRYAFDIYDKNGNFIERKLYSSFLGEDYYLPDKIISGMKRYGSYKGMVYRQIDLDLEEYERKYGPPVEKDWDPLQPEIGGWKESIEFPGIFVNSNGYIKNKKGNITIGSKSDTGHRRIEINGKKIGVHRLIYATFNNLFLNEISIIDHRYNTDPECNLLSNFIHTDIKGNNNNPITKEKRSKKVVKICPYPPYNVIEKYSSLSEAATKNNIKGYNQIRNVCNYVYNQAGDYLWAWEGDIENRIISFINSGYKISGSNRKGYWTEERIFELAKKYSSYTEFIKNEQKCYKAACKKKLISKLALIWG